MFDDLFPIIAILGIIAIALFGGTKTEGIFAVQNIANTQSQTQTTTSTTSANSSAYADKITFNWGSYTNNANQEYVEVDASQSNTNPVDITGWKLLHNGTNASVTIPHSTNLYSANTPSDTDDVWLYPGDRAYIITGMSPIGYGMRANKCSGYLSQFNTFNPSLYTSCPTPRAESANIPQSPINNNCLDLIDSTGSCTIRPQALDNTYTSECQQLFSTTLTYQGCVDKHSKNSDFYSPHEWYVYLKRDSSLWNVERESVTLFDMNGKAVGTISR